MTGDRQAATSAEGAIGVSTLASMIGLCCIGPWAVALFGVSGAATLARFAPFGPYLLTAIPANDSRPTGP